MMGTLLSPSFHCQLSREMSTKPSGTLSKNSSEDSTGVPFIPIRASTLYSVDVNLPTLSAKGCSSISWTSAGANELLLPEIVLPAVIFLLRMTYSDPMNESLWVNTGNTSR